MSDVKGIVPNFLDEHASSVHESSRSHKCGGSIENEDPENENRRPNTSKTKINSSLKALVEIAKRLYTPFLKTQSLCHT